ncbi:MAG: MerR family transcriptional regulator [Myxococcota bacterium]|nr:MerR family transcriptional regulator [Myxococcota bacterium]
MDPSRPTRPAKAARGPSRPVDAASADVGRTAAKYSIRVTSRLTSIELDTLRMWERRYGFPRPVRTSGGSRAYSEADVEALRLIKRALDEGYRPGEIVGKPLDELTQLVRVAAEAPSPAATASPTMATIVSVLMREEAALLQAELRQAAVLFGPKRFLAEVAHPVCVRVGDLWAEGKLEVRHEHLLSECLSAQLRVLMAAYEERPGAPRVLLSTLPNERHGLGLAMAGVYLAVSQVTPVFLGVETPPEQIVKAARSHAADAVGLLVTDASDAKATRSHIRWMLRELPRRVRIWVGGAGGPGLGIDDDAVRIVATWSAMDEAIVTLAGRST